MTRLLQIDALAERTYAGIIADLRAARIEQDISQNLLSEGLPVRGRAISEWETYVIKPELAHLTEWARSLNHCLVIEGPCGELGIEGVRRRRGEPWEVFERRTLAVPLRNRRLALGMAQEVLSESVGVSRDTIQRWELAQKPPRPISLVVWAQKLGCLLRLRPIDLPVGGARYGVRRPLVCPPGCALSSDMRRSVEALRARGRL